MPTMRSPSGYSLKVCCGAAVCMQAPVDLVSSAWTALRGRKLDGDRGPTITTRVKGDGPLVRRDDPRHNCETEPGARSSPAGISSPESIKRLAGLILLSFRDLSQRQPVSLGSPG